MKVAIIGAGIAGLVSCKYAKEAGLDVTVFEQTDNIGGTWVYSDKIGVDKHGLNWHSSMYRNLHTNLPKETMGFRDFEFTGPEESYVAPSDVISFLNRYVDVFGLKEKIKFEHYVTSVSPTDNNKWNIIVKNLVNGKAAKYVFDAVFVCSGHFSVPNLPEIKGIANFKGKVMHSHEYRYPEPFTGQRILVIGAGPSGIDITMDLSSTASLVGFSHHLPSKIEDAYDVNVKQVPDVAQILKDGTIHFYDGTVENYDVILYCTGYKYSFPFLSEDCQIKVNENHVTQLYKHIININHPTMYFIGLPFTTIITQLMDLQVRFCLKFLTNGKSLPSKQTMLDDLNDDIYKRQMKAMKPSKMHQLGSEMRVYLQELVDIAGIEPIKPVLLDIYERGRYIARTSLRTYRKYKYRVVDDHNFIETL